MAPTTFDTDLGQLAIARGLIELPTLLRCVARGGQEARALREILVDDGHMSAEQLEQLEEYLEQAERPELQAALDQGNTLIMEKVVNGRNSAAGLPTLGEVAETLASSPPDKLDRRTPPLGAAGDIAPADRLNWQREERYDFVDELGRGGMGQVLLAHDRVLDREIAIKTLLPDASRDPSSGERLLKEARLTGVLEHPSIIPIYDLGSLSNDQPYYTMRVVRERSLQQLIDQMAGGKETDYSLTQFISILRQVCLALHYAHDRGVVHRDLKPENILIGSYGEVFVIDWGVAKVREAEFDGAAADQVDTDEPHAVVGTPQYMAPEQAQGDNDQIDRRTDVYALGATLYEVLTLTPVFHSTRVLPLLLKVVNDAPEPPSKRAPERAIPRELEDICLKALSKQPAARYQSAEEMADDLELFLEGVKERERRRALALETLDHAASAREDYHRVRREHAEAVRRLSRVKLEIRSWTANEQKERVWELEQRVEDLDVEIEREFGEATRIYGQALGYQPDMPEARRALADLYWERFREAELAGDRARATYFESLVRQYNDGWYDELLEGVATLTVLTNPLPAEVSLYEFVEINRRLVERHVADLGQTPIRRLDVAHGSYVLEISRDGYHTQQVPLRLDRMEDKTVDLSIYRRDQLPEDLIVIPRGVFLGGEIQPHDIEKHERFLPDFAIMRHPVTCGEYLAFLNDLAEDDFDAALGHAPRMEDGDTYFDVQGQRFDLPTADAEGDSWEADWPVVMVSYEDARAYAHWRSKRDGHVYRLPSAEEWEKAARGVDGRIYPWGNHFDPSFCRMRDSERGKPMPVSVDSYPSDRSPYGVRHMAGNVVEWTTTPAAKGEDRLIIQGGTFASIPLMCRLDWHMDAQEDFRLPYCGFRLAISL